MSATEFTAPLIDSHCHLDFDYSPKSETELIQEALNSGIVQMITVATDLASIPKMGAISQRHPQVFHTIGIHPHETGTMQSDTISVLEKAVLDPAHRAKCVAIGEIGLDYYYNHSDKPSQISGLDSQLELALSLRLPVVIHSRDAEDDLLKSLDRYAKKVPSGKNPGVIHCFTGTQKFGQACLDLGFYISFSGILTFKNAEDLRTSAKAFPLEKILVETDSPFLAPVPYRGKKCEPSMIRMTALKLAEIKGLDPAEIAEQTTKNSRKAFGLTS